MLAIIKSAKYDRKHMSSETIWDLDWVKIKTHFYPNLLFRTILDTQFYLVWWLRLTDLGRSHLIANPTNQYLIRLQDNLINNNVKILNKYSSLSCIMLFTFIDFSWIIISFVHAFTNPFHDNTVRQQSLTL